MEAYRLRKPTETSTTPHFWRFGKVFRYLCIYIIVPLESTLNQRGQHGRESPPFLDGPLVNHKHWRSNTRREGDDLFALRVLPR